MGVSEPQRLALHAAARRALGEQEGDTLMALSPPANTDMATMQALERTEERLGARITKLDAKPDASIEGSALRTRLWTFGIVVAGQPASVTHLQDVLG